MPSASREIKPAPCPARPTSFSDGPVGTVGEFTANGESSDGGSITDGVSDTNIVTTDTTESQLSGTYSTVDQNGRIGLVLNADNLSNTLYPTDFAVYVVNANQSLHPVDRQALGIHSASRIGPTTELDLP